MTEPKLTLNHLAQLDVFESLFPKIRQYIYQHLPSGWPDLTTVINMRVARSFDPITILPLASCAAVNGDPSDAVPVAATWVLFILTLRIFDDLQEQDHDDGLWALIGVPRASNYGLAVYSLCFEMLTRAPWSAERYRAISRELAQACVILTSGQDQDLCGQTRTLDDYWRTTEEKSSTAFVFACIAGALCGEHDRANLQALRTFGHHLGRAVQVINDMAGIWRPKGAGDLALGNITLPLLYGLATEHPDRNELQHIVDANQFGVHAQRVKTILDTIKTREFLIWTALQEREHAIEALKSCPGAIGTFALHAYITTIFADLESFVTSDTGTLLSQ